MGWIGREPAIGNYQVCDALTASATDTYALAVGGSSVSPESANHVICSLNGVIQKPGSSFTISGSNIVFASTLASSDSIDFIMLLGSTLDVGIPSDASITNAKLASDLISGETDIGGAIADADLFLIDDGAGGTLRKTAASRIKTYIGGGNMSPSFHADLSSSATISDGTGTDIVFDSENFDNGGCYNNSTGVFTVPSGEGGKYFIGFNVYYEDNNGNVSDMIVYFHTTISSSAAQDAVARAESTSNGTTFTELNLSYSTILTLSAGDTIKVQAYGDTNNSSAMSVKGGGNKTTFFGFKIIE